MGIVSNALLLISGAYLALGLMYLRFWVAERARRDYLAFAITCLLYSFFSWFELGMMHSTAPDQYLFLAYWNFFPGNFALVAMAWFVYVRLHGRKTLFVAYAASRVLAIAIHLVMANGINFRQVTAVGQRVILGEPVSYAISVPNPWMVLPQLSHVLMIVFFLDASVRCSTRRTPQALTFGVGALLFAMTVLSFALSMWGLAPIPLMSSFGILYIVAAMLYELNYDMHKAAMLSEKLAERETRLTESLDHLKEREVRLAETLEQLQLSAAAGNVGMWTRKIGGDDIWVSEKAGEIWGLPGVENLSRDELFQHIHPTDRAQFIITSLQLEGGKNEFQLEYRTLANDGEIRWVHTRGTVDSVDGERIIRGAIVDITDLKLAEEAVRDLSHKLVNAQENERARLARELHDDLNQSIALLTIQLGMLQNEPKDIPYVKDQLGRLVSDLQNLAKDVHRISHELHPGKLAQLGLETALSGFCRDLSDTHDLEIDLATQDLPQDLSPEISLCLYRVTQESLKNIIKHSGATLVHISLRSEGSEVRLAIRDNGNGFDTEAAKAKNGLGLISIDERVRHVGGTAQIISAVGEGTTIEVRIPVNAEGSVLEAEIIV